jgi:hypothetical protein
MLRPQAKEMTNEFSAEFDADFFVIQDTCWLTWRSTFPSHQSLGKAPGVSKEPGL